MVLTVSYEFYRDTYHGKLPEAEFERLSVFASAYLDDLTQGRVSGELTDDVRQRAMLALCAVVDTHNVQQSREGVASESNDGISVTYLSDAAYRSRSLYEAAAVYLAPTGLLYRGMR